MKGDSRRRLVVPIGAASEDLSLRRVGARLVRQAGNEAAAGGAGGTRGAGRIREHPAVDVLKWTHDAVDCDQVR